MTRPPPLLDPETPVPGVTDRKPRPDLKGLGELAVKCDADIPVCPTLDSDGKAAKKKSQAGMPVPHRLISPATSRWGCNRKIVMSHAANKDRARMVTIDLGRTQWSK